MRAMDRVRASSCEAIALDAQVEERSLKMVISDYLEARSPVTGEMFTSKSGIRQHFGKGSVTHL